MLLSPRYRFLFVHIAKTGGTSVRTALRRVQRSDPYYPAQWLASRLSHLTAHRIGAKFPRHARIVCAQEMLPREFFDSLFKFAIVRNPWDLQVSSFHHIRRERPQFLAGHEEFADFMRYKLDPEREYQFHVDTSMQLQRDYLVGLGGQLLTDFVGRYESLHQDFQTICERIGVDLSLPHKRQATDRSRDYRSYYSDDLAEQVANWFEPDIREFGYRFDDPATSSP